MLRLEECGIPIGMGAARDRQLSWLNSILEDRAVTPNALAERAGIAPSTLSKFLSGKTEHLRERVVARIAQVSKKPAPQSLGLSDPDAVSLPIGALPNVSLPDPGQPNLAAVKISSDAMRLAGIEPDDILIYDRAARARTGDIVCAQIYAPHLGGAETVIRYYEAPFLVAASEESEFRKPIMVDGDRVQIIGVVTRQIRVREFGNAAA